MQIKWLGHSCFKISTSFDILTDPYDTSLQYNFDPGKVNIITESHQHGDHAAHDRVSGDHALVKTPGEHLFEDVRIYGIDSFHDEQKGSKRGNNIIFKIEAEGLNVVHLGDLGQMLDHDQKKQLKNIDVLMIPVGGTYTLDYKMAVRTVMELDPKIVIPMHYKTEFCAYPIADCQKFIEELNWETKKVTILELNDWKVDELNKNCIIFEL